MANPLIQGGDFPAVLLLSTLQRNLTVGESVAGADNAFGTLLQALAERPQVLIECRSVIPEWGVAGARHDAHLRMRHARRVLIDNRRLHDRVLRAVHHQDWLAEPHAGGRHCQACAEKSAWRTCGGTLTL